MLYKCHKEGNILPRMTRMITFYFSIPIICISSRCVPHDLAYCDDDEYACSSMLSTLPYRYPIDLDSYSDVVLFADGSLLTKVGSGDSELFSLKEICASDTICDIIFYDEDLEDRNYSESDPDIDMPYDKFIVVVTPTKCCKMDSFDNVTLEFGNAGIDSVRLINAISADINYLRQIFVVDAGDNSIKIYDHNGNFLNRWNDVGYPYRVKIFNGKVLILDNSIDSIKRYNFEGDYLDTAMGSYRFDDITAFIPVSDNEFWVADMGGERLLLISSGYVRYEIRSDYCFWDFTFQIKEIVALDHRYSLRAVDREGNYVLKFGGSYYYYP